MNSRKMVPGTSPFGRPSREKVDQPCAQGSTEHQPNRGFGGLSQSPGETREGSRAGASPKSVLDIDDIAQLFHCSREKIKRMARSGELPAFKFGKSWFVLQEDLERYLAIKVESTRHLCRIQEVSL